MERTENGILLTQEEYDGLNTQIDTLKSDVSTLTAERDSYKEQETTWKTKETKLENELKETKKLNFALARQHTEAPKSFEDSLADAMGLKKK